MSERDSVHKDIEKMQEELKEKNKKLSNQESRSKHYEDDKRKLTCKIEMLKRELEQSLHERDKAMKETHEIRSVLKIKIFKNILNYFSQKKNHNYLTHTKKKKSEFLQKKTKKTNKKYKIQNK